MNTAIDWNSTSVAYPQFDPEAPDTDAAERQARADYVESWCDDGLTTEAQEAPLLALIEQDSGLMQEVASAYLGGDSAELEQAAGRLARALIGHVEAQA